MLTLDDLRKTVRPYVPLSVVMGKGENVKISPQQQFYLTDIVNRPFLNIGERKTTLRLTNYMSTTIKDYLTSHDLAKEVPFLLTTGQGRPGVYLEITPLGCKILGIETYRHSFFHRFAVHIVTECFLKEGYKVDKEVVIPSTDKHYVDVIAEKGKEKIALEIETGMSNFVSNVQRLLEAGFTRIEVVVSMEQESKLKQDILSSIDKGEYEKIFVRNINYYYEKLNKGKKEE